MTSATLPPPPPSTACSDRAAMLRTILERPDDDAPRLVFADWLTENGEHDRAELIFDQIIGNEIGYKRVIPKAYFGSHLAAIVGLPCDNLYGAEGVYFVAERGFVQEIHLPCAAFMEHAVALFAAHPITTVRITDKRPNAASAYEHPTEYWWSAGNIPKELWSGTEALFTTESAANDALSRAAVAYGRKIAGLRPLSEANG